MSGEQAHRSPAGASPGPGEAQLAVARMREMSPDLRGCAVLDGEGRALGASGELERWAPAAAALLAAADAAGGEAVAHVHVATEEGEAFAVRESGLAMAAVAERFVLSSLMLFDMRAVLRDLARGEAGRDRRAPGPGGTGESAEGSGANDRDRGA